MAFRSRELFNKLIHKVGRENLAPGVEESLKKCLPNNKCVMGRAKRGLYAGRHIQFGNQVSEDGGNKTRRTWKPNVQAKRLFSYILDRHIRVKVTTHALRCIDKAGGIDEYLLKIPYHKLDNEMSLFWKAKIEKMYEELEDVEIGFLAPEEEGKLEKAFEQLKIEQKEARKKARQLASKGPKKGIMIEDGQPHDITASDGGHIPTPQKSVP